MCDEGLAGCRVGVHRSHGRGHFYSTDAAAAETAPYFLERLNYFHLYVATAPGTTPLFLCRKADGKHLLTTETDCEGETRVSQIGFIGTEERCGSRPLYRAYHPPTNNDFYTDSAPERDNAVNNLGYTARGVVGQVWDAL